VCPPSCPMRPERGHMQIPTATFVELVEDSNRVVFPDSEFSNLRADFGTLICVSLRPLQRKTKTFCVERLGNDREVIAATMAELGKYSLVVTFYGTWADIPYLRSRALRWGQPDIPQLAHCDLYRNIRKATVLSKRNQGHLTEWLALPDDAAKMKVSPNVWSELATDAEHNLKTLEKRCETDVQGLEALWHRSKHLIKTLGVTR